LTQTNRQTWERTAEVDFPETILPGGPPHPVSARDGVIGQLRHRAARRAGSKSIRDDAFTACQLSDPPHPGSNRSAAAVPSAFS
jgi:hypothetical protein